MWKTNVALVGLLSVATAQFPPESDGITVLKSKFHENVTISFKEVCTHLTTKTLYLEFCV